ncbi:MAG TPA: pyridoxamine 5'-phosphate oxidase family protein [Actinomycetota bacterium]|nr:pyridoxamine 5'-phosphate oxidase family protein [Actinomycetota bacterium]
MTASTRRHPRARRHPGRGASRPASAPGGRWYGDAAAMAVLDGGDLAYLAVRSPRGPHVTPLAFRRQARRLWFVTSRDSVKLRAIAENPRVGGLVRSGDRAVMWSGKAHLVDPLTVRGLGTNLLELPVAVTGYLLRNFREAAGAVRDRPVPTLPIARVLITVDLTCLALLQGWSVAGAWGPWSRRDLMLRVSPPPSRPSLPGAIPPLVRRLLSEPSRPAVLGWDTASGPMAIPAVWHHDESRLVASAEAMALAGGGPRGPACLTVDRGDRHSDPREGFLLRGTGRAYRDGSCARVLLGVNTITSWTGTKTRTIHIRPARTPGGARPAVEATREARGGSA